MIEVKLIIIPDVVIEPVTECHSWSCSVMYLIMTQINEYYSLNQPNYPLSFIQSNYFQYFDLT